MSDSTRQSLDATLNELRVSPDRDRLFELVGVRDPGFPGCRIYVHKNEPIVVVEFTLSTDECEQMAHEHSDVSQKIAAMQNDVKYHYFITQTSNKFSVQYLIDE